MFAVLLIFFCIELFEASTPLFSSKNQTHSVDDVNASNRLMQAFWQTNIHSLKLEHATSSVYFRHFKQNGINATYPDIIVGLISKIRKIWANHEYDITEKTYLFRNFEKRFDASHQKGSISLFFSAQSVITREFTSGYSKGGEWIKEIKYFLDQASKQPARFSDEDRRTIHEVQTFVDLIYRAPSMIIAINADHPSLKAALGNDSHFLPLNSFIEYVKTNCPCWENPYMLTDYLHTVFLPLIEAEKKKIASQYEFKLSAPIPSEDLEFIFLNNEGKDVFSLGGISCDNVPCFDPT